MSEKVAAKKEDNDEYKDMFLEELSDNEDEEQPEKVPFRLGDDTDVDKEKILNTDEPMDEREQLVWRCMEIWKYYVRRLDKDISRVA